MDAVCTCYACENAAVFEIYVQDEDGGDVVETYACAIHALGHDHTAIVLPEVIGEPEEARPSHP